MDSGAVTRITRSVIVVAVAVAAVCSGAPAHADWTGKGEGGLLVSSGNSESTSANAKLDLVEEHDGWKNALLLAGLYGKNASFATAERIEGRYELNDKISEHLYAFGALRGERDLFSGFAYQATLSAGLGYKFIDNDSTKLAGTVGVGYRRLEPEQLIKDASGEVTARIEGEPTGDVVATAGLDFVHNLTRTTKLLDKLLVEAGSNDTSVSNDLGVQVSMNERLALAFGYGVRYNTNPSPGSKKLDQMTTVNIVYSIKKRGDRP